MVGISLPSTTNIGGLSLRTGSHVEGQYNKSKIYYVATSIYNAITEIAGMAASAYVVACR